MNYERLYHYRFRDIDQGARTAVWGEIAPHVWEVMGRPSTVLDPAAGRGEFIEAVPAQETWAVDEVAYPEAADKAVTKRITSKIQDADLPAAHFDGVFVSNFLEHLYDQEAIASFLEQMRDTMKPGGRIAIMGPNYRYASKDVGTAPTTTSPSPTGRSLSTSTRRASSRKRSSPGTCPTPSAGSCRPCRR